ncbi:glycosyl hydrolase family 28-related protein [Atlantibacter subterraneus]|uniref:glycosyl hydrolase family 28-related protein n=1 Tax=Atlantibacter subterraneus TaxID=255519 RepID=UPI002965622C|nr:glycosyl hydrolase family 28-related protein [Atlantibacter subterranea]MDW2743702.1 glycosyl hydrolase family 28-related protein [Atlantibacter subterranea]
MTVSTEVDHNDYTGNGVTVSFPYTFRIFKKSDLVVQVVDLDENITELVLDTDYTVTGAGGYQGGNVILSTALTSGYQISLSRELPVTQETDLRNQGKFFAEIHEDAFDKLTMLIQQVRTWFSLALRKPASIANWYDALNNRISNLADPLSSMDAVNNRTMQSFVEKAIAGVVGGFGWFHQSGIGAVYRTFQDKMRDIVSIKDFGVVGDGIADDSAAFQAALSSGHAGIRIPAGTKVNLVTTCKTPARNFSIIGEGPSSIITGTAHILLETTKSANSVVDGKRYTVTFQDVHFTGVTDDQVYLYLHSVFDYGGSMPFVISGCTFTHGARRQTSVLMTGITGLRFINSTIFSVSGFSAKTDDTGYGLRALLEDDMSSSVMNIHVAGSSIISISRPFWVPPRTIPEGGRCEGIRIENNLMGDGILGIYIDASIAVSIVGNQVSDYYDPIRLSGCQGFVISDNGEITGYNSSVEIINGLSNYVTHNGVISGNSIAAMKDNCRLVNMPNLGVMDNISITGNTFKGWTGDTGTTYGVIPSGTAPVHYSVVANNTFKDVMFPVFFGANAGTGNYESFKVTNNAYLLPTGGIPVSFPERQTQAQRYQHTGTEVRAIAAGVTTITIDVTAAKFREIPVYADAQVVTSADTRLVYIHDSSSFTQLVFAVKGTAPVAASHRLCYFAIGASVYGY